MRQHKQRSWVLILTLLTSLMVGGNRWLYAVPAGWAQTTPTAPTLDNGTITDSEARLDPTVAKELLAQVQTAAEEIQDNTEKTYALLEIAYGYSRLSDDSVVTELLYKVLDIVDETIAATGIENSELAVFQLSALLKSVRLLSDQAVALDLLNQILTRVEDIEDPELQSPLLVEIAIYANELFSDASLVESFETQAMDMLQEMPVGDAKFQALWGLAVSYNQTLGEDATAVRILNQALDVLGLIDNSDLKRVALFQLGDFTSRLSSQALDRTLLERILTINDTLADTANKAQTWASTLRMAEQVADSAMVKELLNQSLDAANTLDRDIERYAVLLTIVDRYGRLSNRDSLQGVPQQLFDVANQIQDDYYRRTTLVKVVEIVASDAETMGSTESLDQLITGVDNLPEPWTRAHVLIAAANGYGNTDQTKTQQLLEQALESLDVAQYDYLHAQVLRDFVVASHQLPDENRRQLLDRALALIKQIPDQEVLSSALFSMADEYGEGYEETATKLMSIALSAIEETADTNSKIIVLDRAIRNLTWRTLLTDTPIDELETFNLLQEILIYANSLDRPITNGSFWSDFAKQAINLSNQTHVNQMLTGLLSTAAKSDNPTFTMEMSFAIAKIYASLSDEVAARDWLDQAITANQQANPAASRTAIIDGIAQIIYALPETVTVKPWLDEWLTVTTATEDSFAKRYGLSLIAGMARNLSDEATVRPLVRDMVASATTINEDSHRAVALSAIAQSIAAMGTPN